MLETSDSQSVASINIINLDTEFKEYVYRSFHLIDPRTGPKELIKSYKKTWEKLGSNFEEEFLFNTLPHKLGPSGEVICQLIASQRSLSNIISHTNKFDLLNKNVQNNFVQQRTDFSIEFPYNEKNKPKGLIIEIDGPHHQEPKQKQLDKERDNAAVVAGWHNTIRIDTTDFNNANFDLKVRTIATILSNPYIIKCIENFKSPIWNNKRGKEILQLALIPFGIARIQRTLIECIAHNKLNLQKAEWRIAVIERDVPCAKVAIEDFKKLVDSINELQDTKLNIPDVHIDTFCTSEFIESNFQNVNAKLISQFNNKIDYDLILDIAILERGNAYIKHFNSSAEIITIRSSHYIEQETTVSTNSHIHYKPFTHFNAETGKWDITNPNAENALRYLLQSFFRKKNFRPGQLPILNNALQCKSVIGLLPTGGGKSITYQLSALLQPGICIVIDPIRSLMKDQVDGLIRNGIDSCVYINSSIQGEEKRKAVRSMKEGKAQFVFISPERLQMQEFRDVLDEMYKDEIYFSYCVIDEAHCVSEWGHDFRTAYLRLGENATKYCKTKGINHIPLFGLTATASYDVLADIQRELSGNDEDRILNEDSIVRSEFSKRDELQYIVEKVELDKTDYATVRELKEAIGKEKQAKTLELIEKMPYRIKRYMSDYKYVFLDSDWEGAPTEKQQSFKSIQIENFRPDTFYNQPENAGLIFCPHTQGMLGVTDKFKTKRDGTPSEKKGFYDLVEGLSNINAGFFIGSGNDADGTGIKKQDESFRNQELFINNKLNMMVATKAFGMGIDKENIRYTIHVNYPSSLESFVQEAGRAGRDKKMAISCILFNDQQFKLINTPEKVDHDEEVNMYFHKNSFKGIEKEMAVLDELLSSIFLPDRTNELESLIQDKLDYTVKCTYWEKGGIRNLYVNFGFNEPLGYLNLNTLVGNTDYTRNGALVKSVNPDLSNKIWTLLKSYIESQKIPDIGKWMKESKTHPGIETSFTSSSKFEITLGFYNNIASRTKLLSDWLTAAIHPYFKEDIVTKMRNDTTNVDEFINEICSKYTIYTKGLQLDFKNKCKERDSIERNKIGHAYNYFVNTYNGFREKSDTEKAIYRLTTLGVIDDYTVDFASNTFKIRGKKKSTAQYKANLKTYLNKYYSTTTTNEKLKSISSNKDSTELRKMLRFLVEFVHDNIRRKRFESIKDIKEACRKYFEEEQQTGPFLKEYIDLYFNSKYARTGYTYINSEDVVENASLSDRTDFGKKSDIKIVWFFMKVVDEDTRSGSQIDNYKHLRGACTRMRSNMTEPNYTVLMLSAFTLYMLEFKNKHYLQEAEGLLMEAFEEIEKKEKLGENELKKIFDQFIKEVQKRNPHLQEELDRHELTLDFDSIMTTKLLATMKQTNAFMDELLNTLN